MRFSRRDLGRQTRLTKPEEEKADRREPESDVVKLVLEKSGYNELNPVQKLALEKGALGKDNMVICSATASGKTAVAEFAFMKCLMESGMKVIYIVPLRALALEKHDEFERKYSPLGYQVRIQTGDRDLSKSPYSLRFDILITTSERCDSILRSRPMWFDDVGIVVVDEIHLMDSENRGPTLEMVITKFRKMNPRTRILALSATIGNPEEIAEWLDAGLVLSDWRPVVLSQGIYRRNRIRFIEGDGERVHEVEEETGPPAVKLGTEVVRRSKQALLFASSRRGAERLAEDAAPSINPLLGERERAKLSDLAKEVLSAVDSPTVQCRRLASCVRRGTAFHHAGETSKQKKLVEDNFRAGLIKIIAATPTLVYGVNLPAMRVVIRDLKRFTGFAAEYIPVLEYRQMCGRAGRPQYDDHGEAISIAKSRASEEAIEERYLRGDIEPIRSKMALEPVLRMHVLGLIASNFVARWADLVEVILSTFHGHQFGGSEQLESKIESVVRDLVDYGFIRMKRSRYEPTPIGQRVSELYIDPDTGHRICQAMRNLKKSEGRPSNLSLLLMICNTVEMGPLLRLKGDWTELEERLGEIETDGVVPIPEEWGYAYEDFLKALRTSLMFEAWINEAGENVIMDRFGVAPGGLRAKLETADWLLYAGSEIARVLRTGGRGHINRLRTRVKYGIKDEVIPLVSIPQVGRVRGRALLSAGFRGLEDLRGAKVSDLARVPSIGQGLASSIKAWVEKNYPTD